MAAAYRFNIEKQERKELANTVAEYFHSKAKYTMPGFRYVVEGKAEILQDSTLVLDESVTVTDQAFLLDYLGVNGFRPVVEENNVDGEQSKEAEESAQEAAETGLTIEIPLDKVSVGTLGNILTAKGELIKKALGVSDIRFEIKEDRIAFPWFETMPEPDEAKAYTDFIAKLCALSKELKHASGRPVQTDNEKYAFRCFLLRLGFIGADYKQERKILLKNLSGNSSWKNGAPQREARA